MAPAERVSYRTSFVVCSKRGDEVLDTGAQKWVHLASNGIGTHCCDCETPELARQSYRHRRMACGVLHNRYDHNEIGLAGERRRRGSQIFGPSLLPAGLDTLQNRNARISDGFPTPHPGSSSRDRTGPATWELERLAGGNPPIARVSAAHSHRPAGG